MQDKATLQTIPAILRLARDHRHPLTPAEAKLWAKVRNRGLGFKIRRHTVLAVGARDTQFGASLLTSIARKQNWLSRSTGIRTQNQTRHSMTPPGLNGWKYASIKWSALRTMTFTNT